MKIIKNIFYIFFPLFIGIIISLITNTSIDMLNKPPLSPSPIVFPIVWTVLYLLMGISYFLYKNNSFNEFVIDLTYYLQLFVNALWSIIFFTLKLRFFAIVWILLLTILVYTLITLYFQRYKISGILQIPYLIWCLFATYLTVGIYLLN